MNKLPSPAKYIVGAPPAAIDPQTLDKLGSCETTMLGHILYWGSLRPDIQSIWPHPPRIVGRALTVEIPASCSAMLHHAIGLGQPGDILVVDRRGDKTYACLGGGVAKAAMKQGIIGAIIDGPCTDADELAKTGFPVWCCGQSPTTTRLADLGGRVNVAVSVGGVAVSPGDAVLADKDGVFILAPDMAKYVAGISLDRQAALTARLAAHDSEQSLGDRSGASKLVLDGQLGQSTC